MSQVPIPLLLRYFSLASGRLKNILNELDDRYTTAAEATPQSPSSGKLDWHRNRIILAQTLSLDVSLNEWNHGLATNHSYVDRDAMQTVLRQIGAGDFSSVEFECSSGGEDARVQKTKLANAVEDTNDLARKAYAHSVFCVEWKLDGDKPSVSSTNVNKSLDRCSILEYCALAMTVVRLEPVQQYLVSGKDIYDNTNEIMSVKKGQTSAEVESRLKHVQNLCWRAIGWDPDLASSQLNDILLENYHSTFAQSIMADDEAVGTLTKYASSMSVAISNATTLHADDGVTRIVDVSYSEKIISVPEHSIDNIPRTIDSISAPRTNSIREHATSQQRQQFDIAQRTTLLQQQLWSEFESLPTSDQAELLAKATSVHDEFYLKVMNTPAGAERIQLMQNMDFETQKLLVIYKTWCGHKSTVE